MDTDLSLILMLLIFIGIWMFIGQKDNKLQKSQLSALWVIRKIRTLVNLVQSHRALCITFKSENEEEQVRQLNLRIDLLVEEIDQMTLSQSEEFWHAFTDHWSRFRKTNLSSYQTGLRTQHNNLVEALIKLVNQIATNNRLTNEFIEDNSNLVLVWFELPSTIEAIWRIAISGRYVATYKTIDQVTETELTRLTEEVQNNIEVMFQQLDYSNEPTKLNTLSRAFNTSERLIIITKKEIIDSKRISLSANGFYSAAMEAVNLLNRLYELEINSIQSHVQKAEKHNKVRLQSKKIPF